MHPGDRVVPIEHGQGTWRTHGVFDVRRPPQQWYCLGGWRFLPICGHQERQCCAARRAYPLRYAPCRPPVAPRRLPPSTLHCAAPPAALQEQAWYRIPKDLPIAAAATMVVK